jgi:hypothetical protein
MEESMDSWFFRLDEEKLHLVVADEDRGEVKNIKKASDFGFVKVNKFKALFPKVKFYFKDCERSIIPQTCSGLFISILGI